MCVNLCLSWCLGIPLLHWIPEEVHLHFWIPWLPFYHFLARTSHSFTVMQFTKLAIAFGIAQTWYKSSIRMNSIFIIFINTSLLSKQRWKGTLKKKVKTQLRTNTADCKCILYKYVENIFIACMYRQNFFSTTENSYMKIYI
jgi:hypothetical protein